MYYVATSVIVMLLFEQTKSEHSKQLKDTQGTGSRNIFWRVGQCSKSLNHSMNIPTVGFLNGIHCSWIMTYWQLLPNPRHCSTKYWLDNTGFVDDDNHFTPLHIKGNPSTINQKKVSISPLPTEADEDPNQIFGPWCSMFRWTQVEIL